MEFDESNHAFIVRSINDQWKILKFGRPQPPANFSLCNVSSLIFGGGVIPYKLTDQTMKFIPVAFWWIQGKHGVQEVS